ncbi:MAG: hypothetical protein C4532_02420 [Candidatus Abyssobacteria bacterium SURF_17]|uniref:Glycosyltransferase RgtA/B/C/D-like domain-containing protein n=1 Tax=Candidatus Abyssobacteria bacterium SURF_17 TaxID=2093361 RepID=A0A419F7M2_9BACT|nr:MAG: hypothetical protein C4532_02420 [Candidatus Abyssubacteria bacterium SURF_17]
MHIMNTKRDANVSNSRMSSVSFAAPSQSASTVSRVIPDLVVVGLFVLLAFIYTYPLIIRLNLIPQIERSGINDQYIFLWNFWWTKKALLAYQNPFFTDYIYYPYGTSLAFHSFPFVYNLVAFLLMVGSFGMVGLVAAYNVVALGSFILGGFFQYLLMRELGLSRKAGFCGGVIFSFSAAHVSMIPVLHYCCIELLPLLMFFALRWFHTRKRRFLMLSAITMSGLLYNSLAYFYLVALFGVPFIVLLMLMKRITVGKQDLRDFALAGLVFGVISVPLLAAIVRELVGGGFRITLFMPEWLPLTADLANYLCPSLSHTVYKAIGSFPGGQEYVKMFGDVFITYSLASLAILSLFLIDKKKNLVWLILAFVSFFLSLGPRVKFGGLPLVGFPMPFAWLRAIIPLFSMFRYPMIFVFPFLLALAVLVGAAMDTYWGRIAMSRWKALAPVPFLLTSLVFLEGLKVPFHSVQPTVPSIYSVLLSDDSDYGVLEWPLSEPFLNRNVLYYQMFHGRKLVNIADRRAVFPRSSSRTSELMLSSPFYRYARSPESFFALTFTEQGQVLMDDERFLRENNIKYCIIHVDHIERHQLAAFSRFIRRHRFMDHMTEDTIDIYRVY